MPNLLKNICSEVKLFLRSPRLYVLLVWNGLLQFTFGTALVYLENENIRVEKVGLSVIDRSGSLRCRLMKLKSDHQRTDPYYESELQTIELDSYWMNFSVARFSLEATQLRIKVLLVRTAAWILLPTKSRELGLHSSLVSLLSCIRFLFWGPPRVYFEQAFDDWEFEYRTVSTPSRVGLLALFIVFSVRFIWLLCGTILTYFTFPPFDVVFKFLGGKDHK